MTVYKPCNQYLKDCAISNLAFLLLAFIDIEKIRSIAIIFFLFYKIPLPIEKKEIFIPFMEYPQCVLEVKIYNYFLHQTCRDVYFPCCQHHQLKQISNIHAKANKINESDNYKKNTDLLKIGLIFKNFQPSCSNVIKNRRIMTSIHQNLHM